MIMVGIVYCISNTKNDKKYVGITTNTLEQRWKYHLRDSKKKNSPLYRSIRKFGSVNFSILELERIENEDKVELLKGLDKLEKLYVEKFNSYIHWKDGGYNLTIGGNIENLSVYSRKKQGISIRNRYKDPEYSRMMSEKIKEGKSKSPPMSGHRASKFDHKIYSFYNPTTNQKFVGCRYDLYTKYNLPASGITLLVRGDRQSVKGWRVEQPIIRPISSTVGS